MGPTAKVRSAYVDPGFMQVLESYRIENAIFQDLESCEKEKIVKIAMENFGVLFEKNLKISLNRCSSVSY